MVISHGRKKHELINLHTMFKKKFEGKVDENLFNSISTKFTFYICYDTQETLDSFVEEYFKMRGLIVDNRNAMIEYLQSDEYKLENLVTKSMVKRELNYWQKLCESVNKFEDEFYEKANVSLLRVENERLCADPSSKREEIVEE